MYDSIGQYAEDRRKHFEGKANRNKKEALFCFIVIIASSISAPIFITLSNEVLIGKIIPSILSILSAGLTTWLQVRKPQKLWGLYRDAQRLIEKNIIDFEFETNEYNSNPLKDKLLVEYVSEICLKAHKDWLNEIPTPELITFNEKKIK